MSGATGSNDHSSPASDDVEDEMMNMEAAFGSAHMVRKRTLRVTNPETGEDEEVADEHIESLLDGQSSGTPTP